MNHDDTIVAPATPAGEGGIGIVRLSGPDAEDCLKTFFRPTRPSSFLESHRLYHGTFHDCGGETLDEVMAVIMRRPYSYTREDVVEIHCHGGGFIVRRILDQVIEAGARLAAPGEFTLRAFLNGRLDLSRAEAVIDVIRSRSDAARKVAVGQLQGRLSRLIHHYRDQVADLLAQIEAQVDFPEEDIPAADLARFGEAAGGIKGEIGDLLETFDSGRILREGVSVLILGRPNVGKSSLLNALVGEARAIVTDIPGTTRDTIEENLSLQGLPLQLVDTAGVRHTDDVVEAEGVRRAREKAQRADLVLLMIDGSRPPEADDDLALEAAGDGPRILVVNKCDLATVDLPSPYSDLRRVNVSAHTGEGLARLKHAIVETFLDQGGESRESVMLSDRRHRQALLRTEDALDRFIQGLIGDLSVEFLALELHEALAGLGEITGETTPDDILERIFSRFCIGK